MKEPYEILKKNEGIFGSSVKYAYLCGKITHKDDNMENPTATRRHTVMRAKHAAIPTMSAQGYMSVEDSRRLTLENVDRIYKENGIL